MRRSSSAPPDGRDAPSKHSQVLTSTTLISSAVVEIRAQIRSSPSKKQLDTSVSVDCLHSAGQHGVFYTTSLSEF